MRLAPSWAEGGQMGQNLRRGGVWLFRFNVKKTKLMFVKISFVFLANIKKRFESISIFCN